MRPLCRVKKFSNNPRTIVFSVDTDHQAFRSDGVTRRRAEIGRKKYFRTGDDLSLFPLTSDRAVPNPKPHTRVTMMYFFSVLFSRSIFHRFAWIPRSFINRRSGIFWGVFIDVHLPAGELLRRTDGNKGPEVCVRVCEFKNNPIHSLIRRDRVDEWVNLQDKGAHYRGMFYGVVLLHLELVVGLEVVQDPPGAATKEVKG